MVCLLIGKRFDFRFFNWPIIVLTYQAENRPILDTSISKLEVSIIILLLRHEVSFSFIWAKKMWFTKLLEHVTFEAQ